MATWQGRCHCGAIGFRYTTDREPAAWSVRACQCTFCRAHAAIATSDPAGRIEFRTERPERLVRYRFGLRSADFLICRDCGVFIGAVMASGDRSFGIVNVNALSPIPVGVAAPQPMSYDGESADQRSHRREERWSPADPP
jgi:hypothetical protein